MNLSFLNAVENFVHIIRSAAKARTEIDSIADQPAVIDMFPITVNAAAAPPISVMKSRRRLWDMEASPPQWPAGCSAYRRVAGESYGLA
jgi:hypothetical protein